MWSNLLYMLPVADILSEGRLEEDVQLEGDLVEELGKLIAKQIPTSKFRIDKKHSLKANINTMFPATLSLWTVFDMALQRFRLIVDVEGAPDGAVVVRLREGAAWKH